MSGRTPLSFANVIASLSLFVALSGTAVAAVALDRDSVGSREIRDGAVRSSELLDGGVRIADLSSGAKGALLGDLRTSEDEFVRFVATCDGNDLTDCPDHSVLGLADGGPARNWLVQAKFQVGFSHGRDRRHEPVRARPDPLVRSRGGARRGADLGRPRADDRAERRGEEAGGEPGHLPALHRAVLSTGDIGHTVFVRMTAVEVGKVRET